MWIQEERVIGEYGVERRKVNLSVIARVDMAWICGLVAKASVVIQISIGVRL